MYMMNIVGALVSIISVVGGILTLQLNTSGLLLPLLGVGLILMGIMCYIQFTSKLDYGVNFTTQE